MNSKLLQRKGGVNQSHAGLDGQHENDSSRPTKGHETLPSPVNPALDSEVRQNFPALLTRNYRRARM
jgi:hypothetical protein